MAVTEWMTQAQCDAELLRVHAEYVAAMESDKLSEAATRWMEMHDLFDLRLRLPLQRTPPESGGTSCAGPPSTATTPGS